MAENLTANQGNPFQRAGLTGDPNTTIWDPFFKPPRWRAAQQPATMVDPLGDDDLQYYAGIMGVSPETFGSMYGEIGDPGLASAFRAQLEQQDRKNRMMAAYFENWRQFGGQAYQQSADILSGVPNLF